VQSPEKIDVMCPECGENNILLWFKWQTNTYMARGSTGSSYRKIDHKKEKVEGQCKCGYKFKPDDLD